MRTCRNCHVELTADNQRPSSVHHGRPYCRPCEAARDKIARQTRDQRIYVLRKHGLTVEQYETMLEDQDHKCKICGTTDSMTSTTKHLSVDHDHSTGEVRGLLCHNCNVGLGRFLDNQETLAKAITYLREYENAKTN